MGRKNRKSEKRAVKSLTETVWLYGKHACLAALANPRREVLRLLATKNAANALPASVSAEIVAPEVIDRQLPPDAVHQGLAMEVRRMEEPALESLLEKGASGPLVILDQVTDPHNVGAILRSAAAFGVEAVIMQDRHSPPESGVLAKAASGALEVVPVLRVTNLSQAMGQLKAAGYWCIGLDGHADQLLHEAKLPDRLTLVMGAEGKGLRRLVAEHCDLRVRLPISDQVESLNVSNAAAVAFYEIRRLQAG